MKLKCILLLGLLMITGHSWAAAPDRDLSTSLKYWGFLRYYEQKYKLPLDTLHAIALKESGKYHNKHQINVIWPWAVRFAGKPYYFSSKKEAVTFVKQQLKAGNNNIDVGCMQINLKYHPNTFASIEQALEPRYNIEAAAMILSKKFAGLQSWELAIAHYHSARKERGRRYFYDVHKIASNLEAYRYKLKIAHTGRYAKSRISRQIFASPNPNIRLRKEPVTKNLTSPIN